MDKAPLEVMQNAVSKSLYFLVGPYTSSISSHIFVCDLAGRPVGRLFVVYKTCHRIFEMWVSYDAF